MAVRIVRALELVALWVPFLTVARAARESPGAVASPRPSGSTDSAAEPLDQGTTRWSRQRLFRVSYTASPSPIPLRTILSWTITITDAYERPITDARIIVLGGMPEHGHGLPTTPQVKNLGGGGYLIEGLKFHMPGAWVVGFRIKAGTLTDSVDFDLQLD